MATDRAPRPSGQTCVSTPGRGCARLGIPLAAALLLAAPPAAALNQPDGTVVPQGSNLVDILNGEGETIDPVTEAAITPQTFTPQCSLTFTVLGRGAGFDNAFGWYNVTGLKPTLQELFLFITCSDGVGTSRVLDVRADPRWLGGEIGFFQVTPEDRLTDCADLNPDLLFGGLGRIYYSEAQYNDDNVPGQQSTIHLLIMDSKVTGSAFYFGWEDLFQGGDNDFEDLLMRVEGIQCSGGGEPCDVPGQLGACAKGVTQCVNGVLECVQTVFPETEVCNAQDDDCNEAVDDGDLCNADDVCDRGVCVPRCGRGEFSCAQGLVCSADGLCVDPACETVSCADGQICVEGDCVGGCEGVICPHGQTCRLGACFDPCAGVVCGAQEACESGVCVSTCDCGENVFDGTLNACVPPGCEGVSCPAGQHCEQGTGCVDDCAGAACPYDQICSQGACIDDPSGAASGGSGGEPPVFGSGGAFGGPPPPPVAGGAGGASGGATAAPEGERRRPTVSSGPGCGCRAVGGRSGQFGSAAWFVVAMVMAIAARGNTRRGDPRTRRPSAL